MQQRHVGNGADRIARLPEVLSIAGVSQSGLERLIKAGEFPQPVRLGKRAKGWRLSDVEAWSSEREAVPSFPRPVLDAAAAIAAAREKLNTLNAEYERLREISVSVQQDAEANEGDAELAALQSRHAQALAAVALGESPVDKPESIEAEVDKARARIEALRKRRNDAAAALPLIFRRLDDAAQPAMEVAHALARLEYKLALALKQFYIDHEVTAAKAFYEAHCRRRSIEFLAEPMNPDRKGVALPANGVPGGGSNTTYASVLRGTFPFAIPGLRAPEGAAIVLRPEDFLDDAEAAVRKVLTELLTELGVKHG